MSEETQAKWLGPVHYAPETQKPIYPYQPASSARGHSFNVTQSPKPAPSTPASERKDATKAAKKEPSKKD